MTYIINGTGYKDVNIHKGDFWRKKMSYNIKAVFKIYTPILTFYVYLVIILIFLLIYFSYNCWRNKKDKYFYINI